MPLLNQQLALAVKDADMDHQPKAAFRRCVAPNHGLPGGVAVYVVKIKKLHQSRLLLPPKMAMSRSSCASATAVAAT